MERLNGLFHILETALEGEHISARIVLNPDHEVYKGHFPGYPVTPGVAQMHIVNALLLQMLGGSFRLQSMPSCKFLKVLDPSVYPELSVFIKWKEAEGLLHADAVGSVGDLVFFRMNGLYADSSRDAADSV